MQLAIAILLVIVITAFPGAFRRMLGAGGFFRGKDVPRWMLYSDREMTFLLSWKFRLLILLSGVVLYYLDRRS